jgi:hypothetical protein
MGGWKRRVAKDRHAWPEKGFIADAPRRYDQQGNDRGKLSANPTRLSGLSGLFGSSGGFPVRPTRQTK